MIRKFGRTFFLRKSFVNFLDMSGPQYGGEAGKKIFAGAGRGGVKKILPGRDGAGLIFLRRGREPRCYRVDKSISGELNFKVFAVRISVY